MSAVTDPLHRDVHLLARYRPGDTSVEPTLLRSIAGIAAGLRDTG